MPNTAKPNILFIMPDQLRADFLSCYGAAHISTPNIDRIANEGVRFDACYSAHPICVPARVAILTGMDGIRNRVLVNRQFLPPNHRDYGVVTWPEALAESGEYSTAAIGKMHFHPWDLRLGFQYRVAAEDKTAVRIPDDYADYLAENGLAKMRGQNMPGWTDCKGAVTSPIPWEHSTDRFTGQETCRFIGEYDDERPFACWVGFPGPHPPFDPSAEFVGQFNADDMPDALPALDAIGPGMRAQNLGANSRVYDHDYATFTDEEKRTLRAHYAALIAQIDNEVGEILDALESRGMLDDTLIIFSADHGEYVGDHGLMGKNAFYQAGFEVPLMVRWPGHVQAGAVCSDLVLLRDVHATIMAVAGCALGEGVDAQPLPGLGIPGGAAREVIIGAVSGHRAIQRGRWRLSRYDTGETLFFDLESDPDELANLADDPDYAAIRADLEGELDEALARSEATSPFGDWRHDQER